jgi:hypothetical protein
MSFWKKLFGGGKTSSPTNSVQVKPTTTQKQSEPVSSDTWEIICPICNTKYHLGVDSFITTEGDTRAVFAGAVVVGHGNIIREDLIRKNGNDLTMARQAELNEETKQKIRKIKEDLKKGKDRKWFCRKCGGPEKGTNPYRYDDHAA